MYKLREFLIYMTLRCLRSLANQELRTLLTQRCADRYVRVSSPSSPASLGVQSTLPKSVLHHLLHTPLRPPLRHRRLALFPFHVTQCQQITQICPLLLTRNVRSGDLGLGLLAEV